jgi:hypothetical protein
LQITWSRYTSLAINVRPNLKVNTCMQSFKVGIVEDDFSTRLAMMTDSLLGLFDGRCEDHCVRQT